MAKAFINGAEFDIKDFKIGIDMGEEDKEKLNDKLDKIVALAKDGVGGEKVNAQYMLRKFCDKYDLDYDEVLEKNDKEAVDFHNIKYKTKREMGIVIGIIAKILDYTEPVQYNPHTKELRIECTQSQYLDLLYATDIYLTAYRKEYRKTMKDLPVAFQMKHELWADSAEGRALTEKEMEAHYRRKNIASGMESVNIRKGITDGR